VYFKWLRGEEGLGALPTHLKGPLLAARNDTEEQAGDRDNGAVIDPADLIDHEALSRIWEIARTLPHEDQAADQKNDRDDGQNLAHS
jgi:hypothetical protein